jgi:hypothetical protein
MAWLHVVGAVVFGQHMPDDVFRIPALAGWINPAIANAAGQPNLAVFVIPLVSRETFAPGLGLFAC